MTTHREDAIACRRHDWSAGHDYRGFQWVEATVCRRCGAVKAPRRTTPREDAIAALPDSRVQSLHDAIERDLTESPDPFTRRERVHATLDRWCLAALGAEAETPHPQRRWHRCEYPGCGLWHDSRDEVTR